MNEYCTDIAIAYITSAYPAITPGQDRGPWLSSVLSIHLKICMEGEARSTKKDDGSRDFFVNFSCNALANLHLMYQWASIYHLHHTI